MNLLFLCVNDFPSLVIDCLNGEMSDTSAIRKAPPQIQSSDSGHTLMPKRQLFMREPFASKHVCFYKSGDTQFNGLPVVINKRTFKTFDGLLDSLSKRVPLPFGVRTITTPHGQTVVRSLEQLHHGHSYICSDKRTVKPINLEQARRKPPPWYHARPVSSRCLASTKQNFGPRSAPWNEYAAMLHTPKRVVVFRNGAPELKHTLLLHKRNTRSFKELMDVLSEVMNFPVHKLYTVDGKRVRAWQLFYFAWEWKFCLRFLPVLAVFKICWLEQKNMCVVIEKCVWHWNGIENTGSILHDWYSHMCVVQCIKTVCCAKSCNTIFYAWPSFAIIKKQFNVAFILTVLVTVCKCPFCACFFLVFWYVLYVFKLWLTWPSTSYI